MMCLFVIELESDIHVALLSLQLNDLVLSQNGFYTQNSSFIYGEIKPHYLNVLRAQDMA